VMFMWYVEDDRNDQPKLGSLDNISLPAN